MIECEGDVYILTESARGKHAGGGGTLRRVVARQLSRRYNFVLKMNDISSTHSAPRVCVCVCAAAAAFIGIHGGPASAPSTLCYLHRGREGFVGPQIGQVDTVLTAKGRITAATYRISLRISTAACTPDTVL